MSSTETDLEPPSPLASLDEAPAQPPFFPVSITKFVVLSILTFGLYELFWFFKNWQLIRHREGHMSPFWRTVFAYFFCYALIKDIRDYPTPTRSNATLAAGPLTAGWIVLTLLSRLPDPYWLISFLAVLFLVPAQASANNVNLEVAPAHAPNSRFTPVNWLTVVIGGILLLLVLAGLTMPVPEK